MVTNAKRTGARRKHYCIWQKRADAAWFDRNQSALNALTRGRHAIIERAGRKQPMVEMFCSTRGAANALVAAFGGSIARWRKPFNWVATQKPLLVGSRLMIVDTETNRLPRPPHKVLVIPAGLAFGTGDHATTAMCLRLLERTSRSIPNEWRFLDLGTGTGILALAACGFGASDVVGVDNDPLAVRTAKENARRNRISGAQFLMGNALRPHIESTFDVIAANVFSELIVQGLSTWRKHLRIGGRLILSGILRAQLQEVTAAIDVCGLRLDEVKRRGKWIAILATRRTQKGI